MLFDRFEKLVVSQTDKNWSEDVALGIEGGAISLPVFESIQKPAHPSQGMVVFDSTLKTITFFDGEQWKNLEPFEFGSDMPIQIKSWYKNNVQIGGPSQAAILWNRFSNGQSTDGQLPSKGEIPFVFKKSRSGLKIDINLSVGFTSEEGGFVYALVEVSKDKGQTWSLIETTPAPYEEVPVSFAYYIKAIVQKNIFTTSWSLMKTELDVTKGDQWLIRISLLSQTRFIVNSSTFEDGQGCTAQSSITLTEINP